MTDKFKKKEDEGRATVECILHLYYHMDFTKPSYDRVDIYLTAITDTGRTYVGDIKSYLDPQHPRYLYKYPDYMIDYDKLKEIKKIALNENRIPILIVVFTDYLAVWDLNKANWEDTAEWRLTNKTGVDYGEKEWDLMAHLNPNEIVYKRRIS